MAFYDKLKIMDKVIIFGIIWIVTGIIVGIIESDIEFIALWGAIGIIGWTAAAVGVQYFTR